MSPSPIPHDSARGSWSPNARLIGPRTPSTAAGRAGSDRPAVIPRSRRVNSSTPIARKTAATMPTSASPAQSYSPTSAMWSAVQRNGLIAARGPPRSRPLATHSTIITMPGDARRAGATEERAEREREPAEEQGDEADPQGEAQGGQRRDLVAEGRRRRRRSS